MENRKIGFSVHKRSKSRRNRCRPRQSITFNNKLSKLKSLYSHLFKKSQKSKEKFNKLSEKTKAEKLKSRSQNRQEPKKFFCDKYPDFQMFLAVNKLRPVGNTNDKPHSVFNKKEFRKKISIWGR